MSEQFSRKRFLALVALAPVAAFQACKTAGAASSPTLSATPSGEPRAPASPAVVAGNRPPKPPALAPELVREFVGKAHSDLARVQELLAQEPGLLNAMVDHGGGDFESALEAAGHVGRRDIAEFLLGKGARMNIFCAAMLGRLDIVKATLDAFPHLKTSKGPHGLMLRHHAGKGGEPAAAVLAYLEQIQAT